MKVLYLQMYEGSNSRYGSLHKGIAEDLKDSQCTCELYSLIILGSTINGLQGVGHAQNFIQNLKFLTFNLNFKFQIVFLGF